MKITLKKGSVGGGAPGMVAEPSAPTPSEESPSGTPSELSSDPAGGELPPTSALPESLGESPVAVRSPRKGVDIFGIVFAVLGFLALAVFVTLLILQGQELSFYKAPPESLWLK